MHQKAEGADEGDIFDRKYREVYESLYRFLHNRLATDPGFTAEDLRGFLKDAYVRIGIDWIGQGPLFEATQSATIAAYEVVLAEITGELGE
ncbi:MAG: hypothetical protein JXC32_08270 [Anaerolineae bacterium]|nr:hypothetical protein [Anaerolineae bacterium]